MRRLVVSKNLDKLLKGFFSSEVNLTMTADFNASEPSVEALRSRLKDVMG